MRLCTQHGTEYHFWRRAILIAAACQRPRQIGGHRVAGGGDSGDCCTCEVRDHDAAVSCAGRRRSTTRLATDNDTVELETCGGNGFFWGVVGVGVLEGREGMIVTRTAVHHPVRVDERESPGELLCEGAKLVLSEALAFAFNEKLEERLGGCAVATFSTPLYTGHVGRFRS